MADYISGSSGSKAPLIVGILAVAVVVILGLMAFGGAGGTDDLSPGGELVAPGAVPESLPAPDAEAAPALE